MTIFSMHAQISCSIHPAAARMVHFQCIQGAMPHSYAAGDCMPETMDVWRAQRMGLTWQVGMLETKFAQYLTRVEDGYSQSLPFHNRYAQLLINCPPARQKPCCQIYCVHDAAELACGHVIVISKHDGPGVESATGLSAGDATNLTHPRTKTSTDARMCSIETIMGQYRWSRVEARPCD